MTTCSRNIVFNPVEYESTVTIVIFSHIIVGHVSLDFITLFMRPFFTFRHIKCVQLNMKTIGGDMSVLKNYPTV